MVSRGSERGAGDRAESSLDAAMRAPSTMAPDVVVIDFVEEEVKPRDMADPKKDLWLSTVDGRYSSAIIPVRVGLDGETFPVHRDILTKSEYFRRALDGEFREASEQAIHLPEEDPNIFSFVIAWLYEEKFVPIKAASNMLVAQPDKGKGKEENEEINTGSEDGSDGGSIASGSDESARERRRRESRRRRQDRVAWERQRRKEPGRHRPDCTCITCTAEMAGPPCWSCGATRRPVHDRHRYRGPPPPQPVVIGRNGYPIPPPPLPPGRNQDRRRPGRNNQVVVLEEPVAEERMTSEDLRTWSLAYTLSVDVYICAERYLMQDFKACIAAFIVNSFEVAGLEAALPAVLQSCKSLHYGISSTDPLLKKVFARVGFMYARLCKNFPDETQAFFTENPELALSIMKEMVERREDDQPKDLPPMDRPVIHSPFGPDDMAMQGRRRRYDGPIYRHVLD